jgi:hypothetical protein
VGVNLSEPVVQHEPTISGGAASSTNEQVGWAALGVDVHLNAYVTIPLELTYSEAIDSENPDAHRWLAALEDEFESLVSNNTWVLVPRDDNMRVIPCRWVFSHKLGTQNEIERFKCRLVAKGFMQRPGFEFSDVYAPVSSRTTLRYFLATVVSKGLILRQLDVKTAFLNGYLEDDLQIYMEQPEGYAKGQNMVCKLIKAIYGLKQAPRAWSIELKRVLALLNYAASLADPALFVRKEADGSYTYVLTYVDDFNLAVSLLSVYTAIVEHMRAAGWDVKEMGFPVHFLSLGISAILEDDRCKSIHINQHAFILRVLEKFGMSDCNVVDLPMAENWEKGDYSLSPIFEEQLKYSSLVGSLMYLSSCTRPDICFAVNVLARSTHAPTTAHWEAAKRVLKYLKGTKSLGILYTADVPVDLVVFSDASYANDSDRRSTTGWMIKASGGAISWNTRRQITVATSSSEAEYQAMSSTAREVCWLKQMRSDLGLSGAMVTMRCDNRSAIDWSKDFRVDTKAKHIDVLHHFIREQVVSKRIAILQVPTAEEEADPMTKSTSRSVLKSFMISWGMTEPL